MFFSRFVTLGESGAGGARLLPDGEEGRKGEDPYSGEGLFVQVPPRAAVRGPVLLLQRKVRTL